MTRLSFTEEYERGQRVHAAIAVVAATCPHLAQVKSGISQTITESSAYITGRFDHDGRSIQLSLREDELTDQFIGFRAQAYHLIIGMPGGGINSPLLPLMDYKRAVDRASSSSPAVTPPPIAGEAPVIGQ